MVHLNNFLLVGSPWSGGQCISSASGKSAVQISPHRQFLDPREFKKVPKNPSLLWKLDPQKFVNGSTFLANFLDFEEHLRHTRRSNRDGTDTITSISLISCEENIEWQEIKKDLKS